MHLDQMKEKIVEAIKGYRITNIEQLEYKTNLSWHDVREVLRKDSAFKHILECYIEKNRLELKKQKEEALERIAKARENRKGYELER